MFSEIRSSNGGAPNTSHQKGDQFQNAKSPLTPETMKMAAKTGLSAAAMKEKLFTEEEHEIQRQSASIISQQLKRLELKLKQFAEVETVLMKQSDRVENTQQRVSTEKVAMLIKRLAAMNQNPNNRPMPQPAFASNMQQMRYLQQHQQVYGYGPRLPLSAINPSSCAPQPQHMILWILRTLYYFALVILWIFRTL